MSIQLYNQPVRVDTRLADSNIDDVEDIPLNGVACEYIISILTTIGKDTLRSKQVAFTVVGVTDDGAVIGDYDNAEWSKVLYSMDDIAYRVASNIAEMSKGVLGGIYKKMGKYRADVRPIDVPTGDNSSATITLTNSEVSQYGNNHCGEYDEPFIAVNSSVYIPWVRDDVSRQDIQANLEAFGPNVEYGDQTIVFTLGKVKFLDDDQNSFLAFQTPYMRTSKVTQYSKQLPGFKRNNDTALGGNTDHVVSEEFNTVETAGVDDGII